MGERLSLSWFASGKSGPSTQLPVEGSVPTKQPCRSHFLFFSGPGLCLDGPYAIFLLKCLIFLFSYILAISSKTVFIFAECHFLSTPFTVTTGRKCYFCGSVQAFRSHRPQATGTLYPSFDPTPSIEAMKGRTPVYPTPRSVLGTQQTSICPTDKPLDVQRQMLPQDNADLKTHLKHCFPNLGHDSLGRFEIAYLFCGGISVTRRTAFYSRLLVSPSVGCILGSPNFSRESQWLVGKQLPNSLHSNFTWVPG